MLIGNGQAIFKSSATLTAGNLVTGASSAFQNTGALRSRAQFFGRTVGIPYGHLAPSSFVLPDMAGAMSSFTDVQITISGSASLTPAKPMEASSSISLTGSASLAPIVPMVASSSISLTASAASLSAAVNAVASGTISLTASAAELGGIIPITASGSITITPSVTMTAKAFMEAAAGGPEALSPQGLANAVMDREVEVGYTFEDALRLILSSVAGKVSGAGTSTITIRSVTDGTSRIIATVDSNGNRTALTYDTADE